MKNYEIGYLKNDNIGWSYVTIKALNMFEAIKIVELQVVKKDQIINFEVREIEEEEKTEIRYNTLEELKTALDNGVIVYHHNPLYKVKKDKIGQYLIICESTNYCIGLTHRDNITMNGNLEDFYTPTT